LKPKKEIPQGNHEKELIFNVLWEKDMGKRDTERFGWVLTKEEGRKSVKDQSEEDETFVSERDLM